ncbi:MAG: hypothetical protein ACXQTS_05985 [Candidatus Methanospirareceae archaeon]
MTTIRYKLLRKLGWEEVGASSNSYKLLEKIKALTEEFDLFNEYKLRIVKKGEGSFGKEYVILRKKKKK